ncbi:hypothetical protein MUK42_29507 [Musa troglodytarum]|uniref:Uncharacterized protein n=1 Tax=Musa troglodytarum TaxID=320322 RepID=A0A9E7FIB5_9LILI|nr:hypothetical protein MUK42_29507 [Musa troglodytarum]
MRKVALDNGYFCMQLKSMSVQLRAIQKTMMHCTTGHWFSRRVLTTLAQILFLLKMPYLRRLAKSMRKPHGFVLLFMMHIIIGLLLYPIVLRCVGVPRRLKNYGNRSNLTSLATKKYEKAVQLNWNSPQALNNWGLALQELGAIVPVREKQTIIKTAISKFRAAIQLQFDFHRAIYNLGTVLYGLAEDTFRSGRPINAKEVSPDELYSQSAIYIAAAHSLKPNYSVYHSALRLVRSMLPLPYFKAGYLTAQPAHIPIAPHKDWQRSQFVLNHEGLQQVSRVDKHLSQNPSGRSQGSPPVDKSLVKVDIRDIVSVSACADLTLPQGAGLCIDTINGPIYLVADTWESLYGWLDAIRLVYTIFARGKSDILAGIITG